jgi:hypothetical protein
MATASRCGEQPNNGAAGQFLDVHDVKQQGKLLTHANASPARKLLRAAHELCFVFRFCGPSAPPAFRRRVGPAAGYPGCFKPGSGFLSSEPCSRVHAKSRQSRRLDGCVTAPRAEYDRRVSTVSSLQKARRIADRPIGVKRKGAEKIKKRKEASRRSRILDYLFDAADELLQS